MTLNDLEPGDIFIHAKAKAKVPKRFLVYGNPKFNIRHGSATGMCQTLGGDAVSKSCRLEVVKVSESIHKDKILKMFKQVK